ncbi:MAG TPA: YlxR family protein [Ktedonobacterales bacterium]|nr:YlxR family protein [Ktedonobacterales bacterium]
MVANDSPPSGQSGRAAQTASTGSAPHKRKPQPRQKHIPQRTCIACKEVRPKRELIRVVRTPDGHVQLDPTSKKSGRGAYVCARRSCWDIALKKGKLEREFETTLSAEDRAALEAYYASLPEERGPAKPAQRAGD